MTKLRTNRDVLIIRVPKGILNPLRTYILICYINYFSKYLEWYDRWYDGYLGGTVGCDEFPD